MVAADDLEAFVDTISRDAPGVASEAAASIVRAVNGLAQHPASGRIVPELEAHGYTTYRELVRPPWRIIYRISETSVLVLAVLDGRRNVEDLLLERLLRDSP
jgi:toxin ParE1/3/4